MAPTVPAVQGRGRHGEHESCRPRRRSCRARLRACGGGCTSGGCLWPRRSSARAISSRRAASPHADGRRGGCVRAKQTTGIASINMTQLRALKVLVPDRQLDSTLFLTTITLAEIRFGIAALPNGKRRQLLDAGVRERDTSPVRRPCPSLRPACLCAQRGTACRRTSSRNGDRRRGRADRSDRTCPRLRRRHSRCRALHRGGSRCDRSVVRRVDTPERLYRAR